VIRHAIKKRKVFPNDEPAKKVIFMAVQRAAKKWTMPVPNWRSAMSRFIILFEERLQPHR